MPAVCPSCCRNLEVGTLRCRWCGADARGARFEARASFDLDRILSPEARRAVEILAELRMVSPAVVRWLRQDPATRGPRPDVRATNEARVDELVAELRLVRERLRSRRQS